MCDEEHLETVAREYRANCVTLSGRILEVGGIFRAGYVDKNRSRMLHFQHLTQFQSQLEDSRAKRKTVVAEAEKLGQQLTKSQDRLQKLKNQRQDLDSICAQVEREIHEKSRIIKGLTTSNKSLRFQQDKTPGPLKRLKRKFKQ